MRALAFTGLPGSGKSEAVAVARDRGLPVITMGDEVRAEAERRGLPPTDDHLGRIASEMRQQEGRQVWAQRCLPRLRDQQATVVVIDGIRNLEEVETFRQNLDAFVLVAVHASPQSRYRRLRQRGRSDDSWSEEALRQRDQRELGWGLGTVMAMADAVITNEGTLEEFREKVRRLIEDMV